MRLLALNLDQKYSELRKMHGGDNRNHVFPLMLEENRFQYGSNASTQLQLFGNFPASCSVDPVNYLGNKHLSALSLPTKRGREEEDTSRRQKLQISLNNNFHQEETGRSAIIPNANTISIGLRLSCNDDEHNPHTVASASGGMGESPPVVLSLGDNLRGEIDRQKEEFDHYIRVQEEHIAKGVREMKQRHMASILSAIEKGVVKKLQEKEIDIYNMNRKNGELLERIKQVAMEADSWHCLAKHNESLVNVLKNNLRLAIARGADKGKDVCGDSEVDDAASYIDQNNHLSEADGSRKPANGTHQGHKEQMACKACKGKEVAILLLPCRHLCLCKDCEEFIDVCPVCQSMKTASFQVYMS